MQSTILPSNVKFVDWIYVVIGLFVVTVFLVANLPYITRIIQSFRAWQDKILEKLYQRLLWIKNHLRERWGSHEPDAADDGIELPVRSEGQEQGARNGEV